MQDQSLGFAPLQLGHIVLSKPLACSKSTLISIKKKIKNGLLAICVVSVQLWKSKVFNPPPTGFECFYLILPLLQHGWRLYGVEGSLSTTALSFRVVLSYINLTHCSSIS